MMMKRPSLALAVFVLVALSLPAQKREESPQNSLMLEHAVIDAKGRQMDFGRDVLRQGPLLVGFIFTRCQKSCPLIAEKLDALSDEIDRLPETGRPRIVLISIDPAYDSPDRLAHWAGHFRNGAKWTVLTGQADDLGSIAKALTGSVPSPGEHSPTFLFIDQIRGIRRTIYALAPTQDVLAEISRANDATSLSARAGAALPTSINANCAGSIRPNCVGAWARISDWQPVVAVHAVLLPSARVLFWSRFNASGDDIPTTGDKGSKTPQAWIWDPSKPERAAGRFANVPNPNTNLFCSGHALLPDGRVMVIGGHDKRAGANGDLGVVDVNVFDPATQRWSQVADMNVERWYPTLTALPDGTMIAIGGSYSGTHVAGTPNQPIEVWQRGGWSGFRQLVGSRSNLAVQVVAVRSSDGRSAVIMLGHQNLMWRSGERADGSFPDFAQNPVGVPSNRAIRIAAVALPNQGLDAYMVGLDNRMWHSTLKPDGTFPDFAAAPVGSPSNRAIDLAVVRRRSGRITVFMVGLDNHLWQSEQGTDGRFPDFAAQPVASKANLAMRLVATLREDDSVELFMIGMDGRIWHSHEQSNGVFPDFATGPVGSPSNRATGIAAAVSPGGRIAIYMVGLDGHLWRSREQTDGTYPEFSLHPLGETELQVRDVSSAPNREGRGDLYVISVPDENIRRNRQQSNSFGWNELDLPRTTSVDTGWYIYYPWTFIAPSGSVFVASAAPRTFWIDLGARPNLREGPPRTIFRDYGSAVMYAPGKIMVLGGGGTATQEPENTAEIIDLNLATPVWRAVSPMHDHRKQMNATLLPDGQVLVTGGTRTGGDPSAAYELPGRPVLTAEMWNPDSKMWSVMSAMNGARTYHSTALLLPDGRVLVAGGGQGGGPSIPSHTTADLYSPPYLFQGVRPRVTGVPASLHHGQPFTVTSDDAVSIRAVTLVRLGSVTHAFDENQRFNRLPFELASPGSLTVHAPTSSNLCPPGHYMLFLLNAHGVPSVARIVHVGG